MIPDFEKVYIVFAAPLAFSILSLMSAIVAVALFLFRKYEDARIIAANSMLYLIISASFYATVVGLIELINPDLLKMIQYYLRCFLILYYLWFLL
jgi:hypothetical protein